MVELPRLDSRCRLHVFDFGSADRGYVCTDASRIRALTMERFRQLPPLHLDLLLRRAVHEPFPASHWKPWLVLHSRWCVRYHRCVRNVGECNRLFPARIRLCGWYAQRCLQCWHP